MVSGVWVWVCRRIGYVNAVFVLVDFRWLRFWWWLVGVLWMVLCLMQELGYRGFRLMVLMQLRFYLGFMGVLVFVQYYGFYRVVGGFYGELEHVFSSVSVDYFGNFGLLGIIYF